MSEEDDYGLSPEKEVKTIEAPPVNYLPEGPKSYKPKIGVIGTGGISDFHLKAYSCLLYTSPSPRDQRGSRMPSSA